MKTSTLATFALAWIAIGAGPVFGGPPEVGEGSLVYRSPVAGRYALVPLVHTNVALDVRGLAAAATVTQQYANTSSEPIEAVYIFPLPHDAAVYDMEIRIGDRIIRSAIREREEAKRVYEAAKSEGKRAALLEEERPNIFTASVANIMPGDRIDVQLRYVEPLRWEDGRIRLVFPMVVGPRYIPGTQALGYAGTGSAPDTEAAPDASRITPVLRNPDSRPGHDISLAVDLDPGFAAASIRSVSHAVDVRPLDGGRKRVTLADGATIPNKDFILDIQRAESVQPGASLFLSPAADSGETHFLLAAYPPTVQPKKRAPLEALYLIDVSGSMAGVSIAQAKEALLQALDNLAPGDRFDIIAFDSGFCEFSPQPLPASGENLEAARRFVQGLQAGSGTEMLPALLALMRKPAASGFLRYIVLLTDGDLGNEEEIFAALRSDLGQARLFPVAIGSAPNLFLAAKMAQFGKGTLTHIADVEEVREGMGRLIAAIESPVLSDVKLTFEGVETAEVYPKRLPDLFLRQPLLVYGRIAKGRTGKLRLTARMDGKPYELVLPLEASKASFHPGVTTLWARQRVEDMMDDWRRADEGAKTEIRGGVIAHAIRYRLVTRFTSLVAVEEIVANASGKSNQVPVPAELPEGWVMEKVAGAPATGTADEFLETLGVALLLVGAAFFFLPWRKGALA